MSEYELMQKQCERSQESIADLYRLDREQTSARMELSDKMSMQLTEIKSDISDVRAKQNAMDGKIDTLSERTEQMFTEMEARSGKQDEITNKLIDALMNFNNVKSEHKWKPKDFIAVVTALGGGAGIAALIMIFIK